MTPSSSPASDRIHAPVLANLRGALLEALDYARACVDNATDHQQPIPARQAHDLLQLTQQIQRHLMAAACLDLSDRS
jgi:hypothetical protein